MKLILIFEANLGDLLRSKIGKRYFLRQSDPFHPSKANQSALKAYPQRSGNQDTPLTPRLRKYFNAPNDVSSKTSKGEVSNSSSKRPKTINKKSETDYPLDKTPQDEEMENNIVKNFGHQAISGQKPRQR